MVAVHLIVDFDFLLELVEVEVELVVLEVLL
jgi:hypothetical protein